MPSVLSAIKETIPISQFNRGLAGKIFTDVKNHGPKVIMKNNAAEAVIISPEEYVEIQEDLNDYRLLTMAVNRMSEYDPDSLVGQDEMDRRLGITKEDLDAVGEVELE